MADKLALSVVLGASLNNEFRGMFGKASKSVATLGKTVKQTHAQLGKIRNYQRLDAELDETRGKLGATQRQAMQLRKQMAAGGSTTKLATKLEKTRTKAERLSRTLGKQRTELRSEGAALRKAGVDTHNLNAANERLTASYEKQKRVLGATYKQLEKRKALHGQMLGIVGKLTAGVAGAAIVAMPFVGWTRDAAQFDAEMLNIGNTAELTGKQIGSLKRAIFNASRQTGRSVGDIQQGIGFLVAAGLKVPLAQRSIVAIGRTATAEAANIDDLSQASFTLEKSMGIKPHGLADSLDILTQAGKEGNVELKDMAMQLPVLGSQFLALKMHGRGSVATMGAALEIARLGAKDADEAANNMRNYMAKILSPTTLKKAKKAFGIDLNQIVKDAQKNGGNPFEASIKALMQATHGDAKAIGEVFQDMQVQNFLRPMMQNWSEYERIKKSALNAHGVVDRDFAKVNKTTEQGLARIGQAWQRMKLHVGTGLGAAFLQLEPVIKPVINGLSKLAAVHPKLIGYVGLLTAGIVGLRVAMMGAKIASGAMKLGLISAQMSAGTAGAVVGEAGKSVGLLTRAWQALNLSMLMSPVGLAIGAVVAAIAVGALVVRKYWQPIKAFFKGVWQGIESAAGPVLKSIGKALAPLKPAWDWFAGILGKVWNWFGSLLKPVKSTQAQLDHATGAGVAFGRTLVTAFRLITWPVRTVSRLVGMLGRAIGTTAGWITVQMGKAANAVSGAWNGAIGMVEGLWAGLKAKVGAVVAWITRKIEWIVNKWKSVKGSVGGLWRKITGKEESGGDKKSGLRRGIAAGAMAGITFMSPAMAAQPNNRPPSRAEQVIQRTAKQSHHITRVDRSTHTTEAPIHIYAAPGMDEKAIGHEVRRQLDQRDRQKAAARRSALEDED